MMSSSSGVSVESVQRRLRSLDVSQETIETHSMYILHHAGAYQVIGDAWLNCFRDAETDKVRLALLYLANDVCQKARRKKSHDTLRLGLLPRLYDAVSLIKNDESGIKEKLVRVVNIWDEREVFDKHAVKKFRDILKNEEKAPVISDHHEEHRHIEADEEDIAFDFDPDNLIVELERYEKTEQIIERARELLPNVDFQAKIKEQLKDRQEGVKILRNVDETVRKMDDFVRTLEDQLVHHHRLVALLEQAKAFYGQQLRDATVVEDAYRKFGAGIQNVKDELEEMQRSDSYLGASPPRDAPSPTANEADIFADGVENTLKDLNKPGGRDLIKASDMELDDEPANSSGSNLLEIQDMNVNQSFMSMVEAGKIDMDAVVSVFGSATPKVDPRLARMKRKMEVGSLPGIDLSVPPPVFGHAPAIATSPWNHHHPVPSGAPLEAPITTPHGQTPMSAPPPRMVAGWGAPPTTPAAISPGTAAFNVPPPQFSMPPPFNYPPPIPPFGGVPTSPPPPTQQTSPRQPPPPNQQRNNSNVVTLIGGRN